MKARVFKRIFDAVSDGPDMEYIMINRAISKVHRHGQGAKGDAKPVHQSLSLCWDKFKFSELPTNLKKRPFCYIPKKFLENVSFFWLISQSKLTLGFYSLKKNLLTTRFGKISGGREEV